MSADDRTERAGSGQAQPLNVVDSRWWYWIVAYLVATVLFVPLVVVAVLAIVAPVFIAGLDTGPTVGAPLGLLFVLFALLAFGVAVLALVVSVMLPVALYLDARQVARAAVDWNPDPVVYSVLGLLQFVVTPLVGFLVALYYLYRRHEHVGVP